MARPAGEVKQITVRCDGTSIRGRFNLVMSRPASSVLVKQALAWVASQAGASALAASITGLSNTDAFSATEIVDMSLREGQGGVIICEARRFGSDGFDVSPTLEQELSAAIDGI